MSHIFAFTGDAVSFYGSAAVEEQFMQAQAEAHNQHVYQAMCFLSCDAANLEMEQEMSDEQAQEEGFLMFLEDECWDFDPTLPF